MTEDKSSFFALLIVGVVALVSLFSMSTSDSFNDLTGHATFAKSTTATSPTYTKTTTASPTYTKTVAATPTVTKTTAPTSPSSGYVAPPPSAPVSPPIALPAHRGTHAASDWLCGDINNNGQVEILDMLLLQQHFQGITSVTGSCADVNGNGQLEVLDALLLNRYFQGMVSQLQCAGDCAPADIYWRLDYGTAPGTAKIYAVTTADNTNLIPSYTSVYFGNVCTTSQPSKRSYSTGRMRGSWQPSPPTFGSGYRVEFIDNVISCGGGELTSAYVSNPKGSPFNENTNNDYWRSTLTWATGPPGTAIPVGNRTLIATGVGTCTDTDGGNNPAVFGQVTYNPTLNDQCTGVAVNGTARMLDEYYCQGGFNATPLQVYQQEWECLSGCSLGACL